MSDCIEWTASRNRDGYGEKRFQGKVRRAHRLAYVEHHGLTFEDIEGFVVMHTCDNPPCINPAHLRLGTQADNVADRDAKGRREGPAGTKNGKARLTEGEVLAIRFLHATGTSLTQIARTFGVQRPAVWKIVNRRSWKHV